MPCVIRGIPGLQFAKLRKRAAETHEALSQSNNPTRQARSFFSCGFFQAVYRDRGEIEIDNNQVYAARGITPIMPSLELCRAEVEIGAVIQKRRLRTRHNPAMARSPCSHSTHGVTGSQRRFPWISGGKIIRRRQAACSRSALSLRIMPRHEVSISTDFWGVRWGTTIKSA